MKYLLSLLFVTAIPAQAMWHGQVTCESKTKGFQIKKDATGSNPVTLSTTINGKTVEFQMPKREDGYSPNLHEALMKLVDHEENKSGGKLFEDEKKPVELVNGKQSISLLPISGENSKDEEHFEGCSYSRETTNKYVYSIGGKNITRECTDSGFNPNMSPDCDLNE